MLSPSRHLEVLGLQKAVLGSENSKNVYNTVFTFGNDWGHLYFSTDEQAWQ